MFMNSHSKIREPEQYSAFVSYRHVPRDRKWAEWLLNELETYRVPRTLRKEGYPARLKKVFRDEDEIPASTDLSDQIRQALENSEYLIVICSSDTPASAWVSEEIRLFHAMGKSDKILALLVEGEPEDAFPPLLCKVPEKISDEGQITWSQTLREPIAADVRSRAGTSDKQLKRTALLRIAAALLRVRFDDLVQRDAQRQRKSRRLVATGLMLLLAIGASVGFYRWDTTRLKVAHFANVNHQFAVPVGVGRPLSDEQRSKRYSNYRIEKRGGKVRALQIVDGRGESTDHVIGNDYARMVYAYQNDTVQSIRVFGLNGKLIRTENYEFSPTGTEAVSVFRAGPGRAATQGTSSLEQFGSRQDSSVNKDAIRTSITQHRLTFDSNGYVIKRQYEDYYGTPRSDANGVFGTFTQYNENGMPVKVMSLGATGEPSRERSGIAAIVMDYSAMNIKLATRYYNESGELIPNNEGVSQKIDEHDGWGNGISRSYLDADGNPINSTDGFAKSVFEYDSLGNMTSKRYYDIDGNPAVHATEGSHQSIYEFDEFGQFVEAYNLGVDGEPVLNKQGYFRTKLQYDDKGRKVQWSYHDAKGGLVLDKKGTAIVKLTFDPSGAVSEYRFFGTNEKPILSSEGYARSKATYNAVGQQIRLEFFNTDGEPISNEAGYARADYTYDARGNRQSWSFFDTNAELTRNADGIAKLERRFDERGNIVEDRYLDPDGNLTLYKGHAIERSEFDSRGNRSSYSFFGINGEPYKKGENHTTVQHTFDDVGNVSSVKRLDSNGNPVNNNDGVAQTNWYYDALGRVIRTVNLDSSGSPVPDQNGVLDYRSVYDQVGNKIVSTTHDANGELALSVNGYAKRLTSYDALGRVIKHEYFDDKNERVINASGYASIIYKYDARGNVAESAYFDTNNEPVISSDQSARTTSVYDSRGNRVEFSYFDTDGKLTLGPDGYARATIEYDERNHEISNTVFGVDGEPTFNTDGYTSSRLTKDHLGNILSRETFGIDGEPNVNDEGVHKIVYIRDALGRITQEDYFGVDGKPTGNNKSKHNNRLGTSRVTRAYDEVGNLIDIHRYVYNEVAEKHVFEERVMVSYNANGQRVEEMSADESGELTRGTRNYARNTNEYDSRGNVVKLTYYDENNNPAFWTDRVHYVQRKYDELDRQTEAAFYDDNNELTLKDGLYAVNKYEYDFKGNNTSVSYFGINREPIDIVKDNLTYSRIDYGFDQRGNILFQQYLGVDTESADSYKALFRNSYSYDARGNTTEKRKYDASGNPLPVTAHGRIYLIRSQYDHANRVIRNDYYNNNGELLRKESGVASVTKEYNALGKLVKESVFDSDGNLTVGSIGASSTLYEYDVRGNIISIAYFDASGRPTISSQGYARYSIKVNSQDRVLEKAWFDADNNPVAPTGNTTKAQFIYSDTGELEYTVSWYTNSTLGLKQKTDSEGRVIESTWLTEDNQPAIGPKGYATITTSYLENGGTSEATFDETGERVVSDSGYAIRTIALDERGSKEIRIYDAKEQPLQYKDGYYGLKERANSKGKLVNREFLDNDGNLFKVANGYAGFNLFYGTDDQLLVYRFFDDNRQFVSALFALTDEIRKAIDDGKSQEVETLLEQQYRQLSDANILTNADNDVKYEYYLFASYSALFARKFEFSEQASKLAIEANPDSLIPNTNLASALMFQGRVEEARELYLKYRGVQVGNQMSWEDGVLGDFDEFDKHGLSHELIDEIRRAFAM